MQAGEKRWGTDESVFNQVFCMRSVPQLQATFRAYTTLSGHEIDAAIMSETSGDAQTAYLSVGKLGTGTINISYLQ